jgi:hypothetical protein
MPGTLLTAVITGGGGTVTVNDDVAVAAIASLTAQVTVLNTLLATTVTPAPGGVAIVPGLPGSIAQSLWQNKDATGQLVTAVGNITGMLEKINTSIGKTNIQLENLNKAAGLTNSHMNKSNRIAEVAFLDQNDKNNFDKKVVNETLKKAGEPPIKLDPVDVRADIQKKITDITNLNAAMAATGVIIQGATVAATEGFQFAQEIVLSTSVGKNLVEYYYEQEIAVTKLFSKERAARLKTANDLRIENLKSGGKGDR